MLRRHCSKFVRRRRLQNQTAALPKVCHASLILHAYVLRPILPHTISFVRKLHRRQHAVERSADPAAVARRPMARPRQLVDDHTAEAPASKFKLRCAAHNATTDDRHIRRGTGRCHGALASNLKRTYRATDEWGGHTCTESRTHDAVARSLCSQPSQFICTNCQVLRLCACE